MYNKSPFLNKILQVLEDNQAIDVQVINVSEQTTITDYMLICSGRSSRHVKAIAEHIIEELKHAGLKALSATGYETGDWVLVDFGEFVIHVMQPEHRAFYNLEELWHANSIPSSCSKSR